ncbi:hypothetical protein E1263_00230 [Kribbella antibiotica]|uniref:PKD domain-containing protein n=1 Tax=Kribbella antibiotica TaxID=190195 RepID=A0A4R4ZWW5_9ACTN|nr:hypothetical protein [Kribbella antibiotica]TDD63415.1 hypothetical protein E1263_00230 [Kribbella antibiotica]
MAIFRSLPKLTILGAALLAAVVVAACNSSTPTVAPTTTPSVPAKVGAEVTLAPVVKGRVMTLKVTVAGTIVVPLGADDQQPLPVGTGFVDLSLGSDYSFGDGSEPGGADGGGVTCQGAKKQHTGTQTYEPADPHTYAKAGTYTFTYKIDFCGGGKGEFSVTKTAKIVIA